MDTPTEFEWDDVKAAENFAKHSVSFWFARYVFSDPQRVIIDTVRPEDGEDRYKAVGRTKERLYAVVFVMRGEVCRLILARRTNAKEDRVYGNR
jgi:uncharacterized protein